MPELPEVEQYRRTLARHAAGRRVERVDVKDSGVLAGRDPAQFVALLQRRTFGKPERHGKVVFVPIGENLVLVMRFGMTGSVVPLPAADPAHDGHPPEAPFARVVFTFEDGTGLAYNDPRKLGSLTVSTSKRAFVAAAGLGPDALEISWPEFRDRARGRHGSIKAFVMDQEQLAGIGNLYADEVLFQAGVHPACKISSLRPDRLHRIHGLIGAVLSRSIFVETDWSRLPRTWLLRRRDEGGPCPHCGGPLRFLALFGRTAVVCPRRQRAPRG